MALAVENGFPEATGGELQKVAALLGGTRVLSRRLTSALDAHELLLHGLPASAIDHLVGSLLFIGKTESLEKAVGMSLRTWQRRRDAPSKPLSQEQSGRAWKFAEILAKATDVLGTQAEAEQWLERPAIGLDQRRPIDLLGTPAGVELIEDYLQRLEYGVYA
ncbi:MULTISPECIES: antitoxin Xre/MbcA/ParS toxin-binding domain-containing protein [Ensifer]|jgi:putative toxin-antitoxin system antitoxin component (TIGR02293 family)|uniref:type II RES/Xre toxin-antitoxin system antitoxin n=1 Tax=Ensifer TaxID=106591 RepID=UPI00070B2533|nr:MULTISPECIES: antitoxin Xre/MbcA/ParS toxin-binding domain-containing protein [Ensifer]KQU74783.1 antitoxin [Ensifer sp. Root31]KQW41295.1 antitoxin [Ensifer sp. Root1252]KQW61406.1 antitoxin [Ensifer sp. Root127]KQY65149.1 antitoxin [Ensifer sp. Root142]KRC62233.1 antitoxin [Ensifer sp. Root231]